MEQQQQNQQQMQNQQMAAPEPPAVMTVKDQLYVSDIMSWNLLAAKKAHFYASQCQDQEVKAALDEAGRMHQRHYDKVLSHLQSHQQQMQQGPTMQ